MPLLGTFKDYKESKQKPAPAQAANQINDAAMLAPLPNTSLPTKEDLKKKK